MKRIKLDTTHEAQCGVAELVMSGSGQPLHGQPSGKSGNVGYTAESGSKFRRLGASL
jgi:hypothetical protein